MRSGGFFNSKTVGSSQFWKGLHKIKHLFKWGAIYKVENRMTCKFWQDCWVLNVPLNIAFEDLFVLARNPNCSVKDCWSEGDWFIDFKRALSSRDFDRWMDLKSILSATTLTHNIDSVSWALDKSGHFTTKSLYRFLTDRGITSKVAGYIWKCKVPLKVKFFLWQVFNNKLQVGQSLIKRGWGGSGNCCVCGCPESVENILFRCFCG